MLRHHIKNSSFDLPQQILNNLKESTIKVDYFDEKGTKNFEDNIPLKNIFKTYKFTQKKVELDL